jgi:signal transduction histidine kinase
MAEEPPGIEFEDIPLEDARRMGRGPRMEPLLYDTLRQKIQSLADHAVQIRLGPEITQQRMRRYIQRIAHELNVPVTVRRIAGGVIFWRSTEEDQQQAQEAAKRLHGVRHNRSRARGSRRRQT